ncbi:MAG: lipocalin-like domain-containing protein [Acidobacteriota bacterium]
MRSRRSTLILFAVTLLAASLLACSERHLAPKVPQAEPLSSAVETLAGGDTEGYEAAIEPREFVFPKDHGPHPEFKTEWWYFTGHLEAGNGNRFGYQLTFFRQALAPDAPQRTSSWGTRQMIMAHFAVTDVADGSFYSAERLSRAAAGLAGAEGPPLRVWLEDWSITSTTDEVFPLRLRAESREASRFGIDLTLESLKPVVLHGDRGLSQKGDRPGDASYYFSLTRLQAQGEVTIGERVMPVTGSSWLDREWSTSALGENQTGWDWFSVQLEDQRELMIAQLRLTDGSVDPVSHGTLVEADGSTRPLVFGDFEIEVLDTWRSDHGAEYPSRWRARIPSADLDLFIEPLIADQELDGSFRYWEGAVEARSASDTGERGLGYVELVGYADEASSDVDGG